MGGQDKMNRSKGPQFVRFFKPIIEVLKESGGSGTVAEVIDRVVEKMRIPESEQQEILKGGQTRVRNQIQWARFYLANAGYIASSKRGIWTLTEKGLSINAMTFDTLGIFKEIHKSFQKTKKPKEPGKPAVEETEEEDIEPPDHRTNLLNLIKSLPPSGFERLSQRLLRESGFQKVVVTGRTGDGGIDGVGILQVNPFVSFNVLFQCKRYQGAVTPSQIRDFRGAMMGRADKGIIITTGTFTLEAKKEARRDGAPPIELVDGDSLVQMFEQLQLGLIPRTTYDVDEKFFDDFKK
jgi:restriction system protein